MSTPSYSNQNCYQIYTMAMAYLQLNCRQPTEQRTLCLWILLSGGLIPAHRHYRLKLTLTCILSNLFYISFKYTYTRQLWNLNISLPAITERYIQYNVYFITDTGRANRADSTLKYKNILQQIIDYDKIYSFKSQQRNRNLQKSSVALKYWSLHLAYR